MAFALVPVGVVGQARSGQGVGEIEPRGLLDPELLSQQAALVVGEGTAAGASLASPSSPAVTGSELPGCVTASDAEMRVAI
jgi:hypothetical protein